jgi:hypothetical protein
MEANMLLRLGIVFGVLVVFTFSTRLQSQILSVQLDEKELSGVCWLCTSPAREAFQKEIGLNDEQKRKINLLNQEYEEELNKLSLEFNQEYEDNMRKYLDGTVQFSDRNAKFEKQKEIFEQKANQVLVKANAKAKEMLSTSQLDRVIQIEIQCSGIHALEMPSVSRTLKLSDKQKKEIRREIEEAWKKVPNLEKEMSQTFQELSYEDSKAVSTKSSEERGEAMKEATEKAYKEIEKQYFSAVEAAETKATEKALGILTSEQRDQFVKLQGEIFEFVKSNRAMLIRVPRNK